MLFHKVADGQKSNRADREALLDSLGGEVKLVKLLCIECMHKELVGGSWCLVNVQ